MENSRSSQPAMNRAMGLSGVIIGVVILLYMPGDQSRTREIHLKIDPNTAPSPVLDALPGLGQTRVNAIIQARQERPYSSIDDLDRRIRGIGPATIRMLRPHLQIGESTP